MENFSEIVFFQNLHLIRLGVQVDCRQPGRLRLSNQQHHSVLNHTLSTILPLVVVWIREEIQVISPRQSMSFLHACYLYAVSHLHICSHHSQPATLLVLLVNHMEGYKYLISFHFSLPVLHFDKIRLCPTNCTVFPQDKIIQERIMKIFTSK